MSLVIDAPKVPLEEAEDGVIRVAGTRVTLQTVVTAFRQGATAEEIAQQYSSLQLVEVYEVIGYYLRRQREVDEYIRMTQGEAEAIQRTHETRYNPVGIRQRLLARSTTTTED